MFILRMIDTGVEEGAKLLLDGRKLAVKGYEKGTSSDPPYSVR